MRYSTLVAYALPLVGLAGALVPKGAAQTVFDACYVDKTGVIYLIDPSGTMAGNLPTDCAKPDRHVRFSWTDGKGADHGLLTGLLDDDHPQYLLADGDRVSTGFAASGNTGSSPASGAGTRLMWHAGKSALRAGTVTGAAWDDSNVGNSSIAAGYNTMASGDYSAAMNHQTAATGDASIATGDHTGASGGASTAMGYYTIASGSHSIATGDHTTASGSYSTAMGVNAQAIGLGSAALGFSTTASGDYSTAMGFSTTASGANSTAVGNSTTASGNHSTAMGLYTTASGDASTAMGSTASTDNQRGAFVYGDNSTATTLLAPAANSFTVRSAGGATFYSSSDLSAGVYLAPGAGAWADVSDRNRKRDFRDVGGEAVLASIAGMPIQSWSYRTQDPSIRHLGPVAQDFYAAFGLGDSDLTITTSDISGVNMLAIQALEKRTRTLQAENKALRDRLARDEAILDGLSEGRK